MPDLGYARRISVAAFVRTLDAGSRMRTATEVHSTVSAGRDTDFGRLVLG
jgi:hypothetical protein